MPRKCFYCKHKGHVLKDCPKQKKGVRPQNYTNNMHTDANHVNLDKSQQSHLGDGSEKGKNVQPSKDEKGKIFKHPRMRYGDQLKSDTQYPINE